MALSPEGICTAFRNWFIHNSGLRWSDSRRNWTLALKAFFGQLGLGRGFTPIYTGSGQGQHEYLVDLVWKVEGPRRYLELALESELSRNRREIMSDFEKLLDVKANIKVCLFELASDIGTSIIQEMQQRLQAQAYPIQQEKCLIILLRYLRNQRQVEIRGVELDVTGNVVRESTSQHPFPN